MSYSARTLQSLQRKFENIHTLSRILNGDTFTLQGTDYAIAHYRNKPSYLLQIDKSGLPSGASLDLGTLVSNLSSVTFKEPPKSPTSNPTATALRKAMQGDDFHLDGKTRAITHYAYTPAQLNELTPSGQLQPTTLDLGELVNKAAQVSYPPPISRSFPAILVPGQAAPAGASSQPVAVP